MRRIRAFTLIEMLVVVAIIALLLGIMMPSLREVRRISKKTVCQKNLDQIGLGLHAYLLTHKETFPYAARLPSWEVEEAIIAGRKPWLSLPVALKRELGTTDVFACPADRNTMCKPGDEGIQPDEEIPTDRYFEHEGTSYEWESTLNGQTLGFKLIRVYSSPGWDDAKRGRVKRYELAKVDRKNMWMLYDFEAFHGGKKMIGSQNILYTDLHVESDKWEGNKRVGKELETSPPARSAN